MLPADTFYRIAQKASLANGDLLPLVIHATMAEVGFLFELDLDNYDAGIAPVLNRQKTNWQGAEAVAALVGFEMEKLVVQASTEGKPIWRFIKTNGKNYIGITVPVRLDRGRTKCISVVVQNTRSANGKSIAAVLQGYGNWFFFVDAGQEKGKKSWVFDNVAAIIELNGLCAAAGEEVQTSKIELEQIEVEIERHMLRSPIDGIVARIYRDVAESAVGGETVVASIVNLDQLNLVVHVPAVTARGLKAGSKITVAPTLSSLNDSKTEATIAFVSPVVNASSGTKLVRLQIENPVNAHESGVKYQVRFQPVPVGDSLVSQR